MSLAHVERFAEMIMHDPALKLRLTKHKDNMDIYTSTAVMEGKSLGLSFTAEEFGAFVLSEHNAATVITSTPYHDHAFHQIPTLDK
jgi:hypothetical protein